jgi:8-oxo-dGTP pyrophosphatase MutT (NUDIX family)
MAAVIIYLTAFFQGRDVSFWPPKIGTQPFRSEDDPERKMRGALPHVGAEPFSFLTAKNLERSHPLEEVLDGAGDLIIAGVALGQAVQRHVGQLEGRVTSGAHLRFLLLDSNSTDVERIARSFETSSSQVRDDIRVTLRDIESLSKKASTSGRGSVEVRLLEREPVFSFILRDSKSENGCFQGALRVYGHRSTTRPNFELRPPNPWYYYFVEICEGLWASAEVWKGKAESMKPVSTKAGVIPYRIIQSGEVEVALITSRTNPDKWIFPVGEVEPGESLPETARRECREESGYIVEIISRLGQIEFDHGKYINRMTFFVAEITGEAASGEPDRHRRWVKLEQLAESVADDFKTIAQAATAALGGFQTSPGGLPRRS